jgi:hypothetical protein
MYIKRGVRPLDTNYDSLRTSGAGRPADSDPHTTHAHQYLSEKTVVVLVVVSSRGVTERIKLGGGGARGEGWARQRILRGEERGRVPPAPPSEKRGLREQEVVSVINKISE